MKYIDMITENREKNEIIQNYCPSDFELNDHKESSLYKYSSNIKIAGKKVIGCSGMLCTQCWNRDVENTKIHLCDTCKYVFPECNPEKIEFGDGFGNDNVIECSQYESEVMNDKGN